MITFKVEGVKKVESLLLKIGGEAAHVVEASVRFGSFMASSLLKQRVAWSAGGYDSFWGKLSPAFGPYLRGRSGETSRRITAGAIIKTAAAGVTTYSAVVSSPDAHVAFHERGGVIPFDFPGYRLSPQGYLRIPTIHAQTPAGTDRYGGQSIRDIPGAFLFKSKLGNLWAAVRHMGVLRLLYLLRKRSPAIGQHRARKIFETTANDVQKAVTADATARISRVMHA